MQDLKYITVLAVAICLTLISASMTVIGFTSLYAGRTIVISALFVILEITKATIFGIIFVYGDKKHKLPLIIIVSFLIVLSFIGHISYLSYAYQSNKAALQVSKEYLAQTNDSNEMRLKDLDYQIKLLKEQIQEGKDEIQMLATAAKDLQSADSRHWATSANKKRIKEIQDTNLKLLADIKELTAEKSKTIEDSLINAKIQGQQIAETTNRSVFQYTAELFNTTQDKLASVINFILALVIDTLALVMLWVAGGMWKKRRLGYRLTPPSLFSDIIPESEFEFEIDTGVRTGGRTRERTNDETLKNDEQKDAKLDT